MEYTNFKELHIRECAGATHPVEIVNEKEELIATVYSRRAARLFKASLDMYEALLSALGSLVALDIREQSWGKEITDNIQKTLAEAKGK